MNAAPHHLATSWLSGVTAPAAAGPRSAHAMGPGKLARTITPGTVQARLPTRKWPRRRRGGRPGFGEIAVDRTLVCAVQPAVLGAVPAVAVVLKLVVMPGDARLLDRGVLMIIHVHTSLPHLIP